ncbi:MAG: secretin N-terminal domain-containing protein, partial [Thermoanaerobaculia bacterium]
PHVVHKRGLRSVWSLSAAVGLLVIGWPALAVAAAQSSAGTPPALVVHAYTLEHQPAVEAIGLIHPLLTERGSVELQPGGNTLVVRDTAAVVRRAVALLEDFDHPRSPIHLEIKIVRAGLGAAEPEASRGLSPALLARLRDLLRYENYRLLADARIVAREAEEVSYRVGDDYRVTFRMGTLMADRRIKLHGFQVAHQLGNPEPKELIHTNLNLWLSKPMILGLAKEEASKEALMVILTCNLERPAVRQD